VRLARHGDFNSYLDYQVLFRLMELEGLETDTQRETYDKIYAVEADYHRRMQEERERNAKSGAQH